jgi:hypothetical protein
MTPDEHFVHLAEFIRAVELSGGTTPHVAMTVESMSRLDDPLEKLWFAGCYALAYNWPTAERLFLEWRPEQVNPVDFEMWLEEHWAGVPLRKERKAIFRKPYFARSASTYVAFIREFEDWDQWPTSYSEAFNHFNASVFGMGRYIAIRWLEVMRRAFPDRCRDWVMPDIHADGGEHPRKALALIYPEDAPALLGGNGREALRVTDRVVDRLLLDLRLSYNMDPSYYTLQSLLCEYKQSALGKKQYPGKSIDTEMDYAMRVAAHWQDRGDSEFTDVRRACFQDWSLGEVSGWVGVRPELGAVLVDYGYTWSDAIYDYSRTVDFKHPAWRPDAEGLLA